MLVIIFWNAFAIVSGLVRWQQGFVTARFFMLAWLTLFLGGILMALAKFNIISSGFVANNMLQVGTSLEVVLLALALADRMNHEKRQRYVMQQSLLAQEQETIKAQQESLAHEREVREAQSKALDIQKRATEQLELRVKERTAELESANQQLELMSSTDPLTGAFNRRYFDQAMAREMGRMLRQREPLGLLMVDIDFFKKINDRFGHQVGDEALKVVVTTMKAQLKRSTDIVARFGGEEFVLALPNTEVSGAMQVAEQIRKNIEMLDLSAIDNDLSITVSIGVCVGLASGSEDYELWLRKADAALYRAKQNGRNQVVFADLAPA